MWIRPLPTKWELKLGSSCKKSFRLMLTQVYVSMPSEMCTNSLRRLRQFIFFLSPLSPPLSRLLLSHSLSLDSHLLIHVHSSVSFYFLPSLTALRSLFLSLTTLHIFFTEWLFSDCILFCSWEWGVCLCFSSRIDFWKWRRQNKINCIRNRFALFERAREE